MGYFSNGTEGAIFEEQFCSRCIHSDYREGKEFGDKDNPPCPVWMAHLLYAYEFCNEAEHPAKVMLDMLIRPTQDDCGNECQLFVPRTEGLLPRGREPLAAGSDAHREAEALIGPGPALSGVAEGEGTGASHRCEAGTDPQHDLDPRQFDLARLTLEASFLPDDGGCPNGPDEYGNWPCDPKGYFGSAEYQMCGRIGQMTVISARAANSHSETPDA